MNLLKAVLRHGSGIPCRRALFPVQESRTRLLSALLNPGYHGRHCQGVPRYLRECICQHLAGSSLLPSLKISSLRSLSPFSAGFVSKRFPAGYCFKENLRARPFELLALLLLTLPFVFTFMKFVVLLTLAERSHQLFERTQTFWPGAGQA